MSARTAFLSRLIGLYCLLISLPMIARRQATIDMVTALVHDTPVLYILGVMVMAVGLAMILAHNVWSGGAVTVIITLIGWTTLIKGLLFLFLSPQAAVSVFFGGLHYDQLFYLYTAISLGLGLYLTYWGFKATPR
jgi:hypothetical protein